MVEEDQRAPFLRYAIAAVALAALTVPCKPPVILTPVMSYIHLTEETLTL